MTTIERWIEQLTRDRPTWTDAVLNGGGDTAASAAFVDAGSGLEPIASPDLNELRPWIVEQLSRAGRTWDARHPFADATIATSNGLGVRVHAAFPPIAEGILLSLRRLPQARGRQSGRERWARSRLYPRLEELVRAGESVLVCGATGSGKTTLAADLLSAVDPIERVVALEDTPELAPAHPHFIRLLSRPANADGFGQVTVRDLFRQALRMRPDRIVLGECRGPEVLDLLQALNSGHRGALATLHANSPRDALRRIELLCMLAGAGLAAPNVRELLACGIGWIAHVRRVGAAREISELSRVEGREGDTILLRPVLPLG